MLDFGVSHEMVAVHEVCFHQRQQRELDSGRIAAGVRHEARAADLLPVDLGKAVDGLGHAEGGGMLHLVPTFPGGDVLQAEVGRRGR